MPGHSGVHERQGRLMRRRSRARRASGIGRKALRAAENACIIGLTERAAA